MKKQNRTVKTVAVILSPLLLSLGLVLAFYLVFGKTLSPYVSLLHLVTSDTPGLVDQTQYDDIFKGYHKGENPDVVDGNDIEFPSRGARYAHLSIPSCGIETDIFFDDSEEALSRGGVGQSYTTRPIGFGSPVLISGHNNGVFNALQHIQVGDIIHATTNYGEFEYQVRETVVKKAADFTYSELTGDSEVMILYTCYPFSMLRLTPDRFFVYADKISGPYVTH